MKGIYFRIGDIYHPLFEIVSLSLVVTSAMQNNSIDASISMPQESNMPMLLHQMGPARESMAVVQPVVLPILPNHLAVIVRISFEICHSVLICL